MIGTTFPYATRKRKSNKKERQRNVVFTSATADLHTYLLRTYAIKVNFSLRQRSPASERSTARATRTAMTSMTTRDWWGSGQIGGGGELRRLLLRRRPRPPPRRTELGTSRLWRSCSLLQSRLCVKVPNVNR